MQKIKTLLISLVILIAIVVALPVILPLNMFLNDVTAKLQRVMHGPVQVRLLRFEYSPRPALVLQDVTLDNDPTIGHIEFIRLPLSFYNLTHWGSAVRDVSAEGARFSPAYAAKLADRMRPRAGDTLSRIDDLQLQRASIMLDTNELGPVDGILRFDSGGNVASLSVSDASGQSTLDIQPQGTDFAANFNARHWTVPLGYPVVFDALQLKGVISQSGLQISQIQGELYSGVVTGTAQLDWTNGWKLSGALHGSSLQAEPLSMVFSPVTHLAGRLEGDATFTYESDSWTHLFEKPAVLADIHARDGYLHNFDLVAPLKSSAPVVYARGGRTAFDNLTAKVAVQADHVDITDVKLDSGKFTATGQLHVAKGGKLQGQAQSRLASGGILAVSTVRVGGLLDTPAFSSSGAHRAGHDDPLDAAAQVQQNDQHAAEPQAQPAQ
ncbi:uncharacterized protein involved in outer membrane biogenesis [Silvimonas terrae]|uniref:Uncharacterized protein involved in outer membrane biogenesis n=1 Tax=Silvimonas terrae TaxID=300266 RepID=A0A840RG63_9NEIS|nr:hypothetical protein [Silvimonas terrae]MBB5191410.1 uncharacterized protein involved in outer membrane biogenesis [Silvimonas terrae]